MVHLFHCSRDRARCGRSDSSADNSKEDVDSIESHLTIDDVLRIHTEIGDHIGLPVSGVYYSAAGEVSKRFHIRDGMGVERLRKLAGIDTALVSGEGSPSLKKRAEKLSISECHLGIEDKAAVLQAIATRRGLALEALAYLGDDVNDLEAMALAGLSACPGDAYAEVREKAHIVCAAHGGQGAFRELAEILIAAKTPRPG